MNATSLWPFVFGLSFAAGFLILQKPTSRHVRQKKFISPGDDVMRT